MISGMTEAQFADLETFRRDRSNLVAALKHDADLERNSRQAARLFEATQCFAASKSDDADHGDLHDLQKKIKRDCVRQMSKVNETIYGKQAETWIGGPQDSVVYVRSKPRQVP